MEEVTVVVDDVEAKEGPASAGWGALPLVVLLLLAVALTLSNRRRFPA